MQLALGDSVTTLVVNTLHSEQEVVQVDQQVWPSSRDGYREDRTPPGAGGKR